MIFKKSGGRVIMQQRLLDSRALWLTMAGSGPRNERQSNCGRALDPEIDAVHVYGTKAGAAARMCTEQTSLYIEEL